MNILYYFLNTNEFNHISTCLSIKEIWNGLEVIHEDTNQVKESKMNMLIHEYKLFKIKSDESIIDMLTRFTDIINDLKNLGKDYTNNESVCIRSLSKIWEVKVIAIQEISTNGLEKIYRLSYDS